MGWGLWLLPRTVGGITLKVLLLPERVLWLTFNVPVPCVVNCKVLKVAIPAVAVAVAGEPVKFTPAAVRLMLEA